MTDTPATWVVTPIGSLCGEVIRITPQRQLKEPFQYIDISSIDSRSFQIADPKLVAPNLASSRARQVVKAGDTLFSTTRVYLKNIAIVPSELDGQVASTAFCVLRPNAELLESRYLHYFVTNQNFINTLTELQRGNSPPAVLDEDVRRQSIPLAPLNEQRRIVSKMEELFSRLDEGEAALRRVQRLLVSYRQAVLKAAVTGELTKEWREANQQHLESGSDLLQRILAERKTKWEAANPNRKYQPPAPPDITNLPSLPSGWHWVSVEQIGSVQLGRQRSPSNHKGPHMRPYLRAANATWEGVKLSDVMEMNFSPAEFERYRLTECDILLSEASGSANEVGKPFIWHEQIPDCCFQNTLIRVKVDRPFVEPMYVLTHFQKDARTGTFATLSKGIGIHHLGAEKLAKLPLALAPLFEQKIICDEVERRMSIIDNVSQMIKFGLQRSGLQRQSILKAAFSGQLVEQDPFDEPSSALLQRIQAVRQTPSRPQAKGTRPPKQATLWEPI